MSVNDIRLNNLETPIKEAELRILRLPEVMVRTGLAESTLYAGIRAGKFPKPVPLLGTAKGWVESEITDWIAARISERQEAGGTRDE